MSACPICGESERIRRERQGRGLFSCEEVAARLEELLRRLDADVKVALLHYSPVEATLAGERLEIYPFLGSYLLGEAVDAGGARLALHGHAHLGTERGTTAGGVEVRNVALPVLKQPYAVYPIPIPP